MSKSITNPKAPTAAQSALTTAIGTVLGTAVIIGIHHRYRKTRLPQARLRDYTDGLKDACTRVQYTAVQAQQAWPHPGAPQKRASDNLDAYPNHIIIRPVSWVSGVAAMPHLSDSANASASGFGVVGVACDRSLIWQTQIPERVHDIVVQPIKDNAHNHHDANNSSTRHVVVMGRRPSARFWVLNAADGQVVDAIIAKKDRHFYGHACYSLDGTRLYVTENDTVKLTGKIGVYDAADHYKKIDEFDAFGIGPHELIMHPDDDTLVIANGGIKTEQASREELNLDTMRPALTYMNRHDGRLIEQIVPEHNQMSVRHLAIHDDGTVMIGIQFQGEKHINVPLVLTHALGDKTFTALDMPHGEWQRFHQYIASVAVDSARHLLCVTTPIGGCAAVFDLSTYQLIGSVSLPDCAGASIDPDGDGDFIVSDGQGNLTQIIVNTARDAIATTTHTHAMSFDNHLQHV